MTEAPNLGSSLIDRSRFEPHLQPGERILWAGRPGRMQMFGPGARRKYFSYLGRLALVVAAYGLLHAYERSENLKYIFESSRPSFYLALVVVFAALALLMTLGALLLGFMRMRSLRFFAYALTDRRVLVHDGGCQFGLQAEDLETITRLGSEIRPDGTGSLSFHRKRGWSSSLWFQEIDNAAMVLRLAQNALAKLPPGPWA
jgi:hypothetical protein